MRYPDLFSSNLEADLAATAPLAARMRPKTLAEVVGQQHLLGPGAPLRVAVDTGTLSSMLFYGPPGTGKTTVARLLAAATGAAFEELSAVSSGVAEVRGVIDRARDRRAQTGERTILFIDEIHRFSKAQQDALLHAVEDGIITLIGASTENPYIEVIPALISRCELFCFHPLSRKEILVILERALAVEKKRSETEGHVLPGLGEGVLDLIAEASLGDARRALSLLERALVLARARGVSLVDRVTVEEAAQRKIVLYDKDGDAHYDVISAFIKSLRGSDPDAALYYLAVMLLGGEDPRFIARRMVIFASEDIGNADSRALEIAVAAAHAVELVGLPECRINLAQAVTYLSCAPKSNASYLGIEEAMKEVTEHGALAPPVFLRSTGYRGAEKLGHGVGYKYPHDFGGYADQRYLPEELAGREFYHPTLQGEEARIREFLEKMRKLRQRDVNADTRKSEK